jgi:poly(glycerol-phosphate) alpha-glucosyltransferase
MRNLVIAIKDDGRYEPSVMGMKDEETDRDQSLWDHVETTGFAVKGPAAFGYAPELAAALERSKADILHVHGLWMYPSVAATRWSGKSKPYIVSPHGMLDPWALRNSQWKKRISALVYENRHLRGAACLHALNLAEAKAIRKYGFTNPICIIPNGINLPGRARPAARGQVRTLLYLGRLHPKKGLPRLLEAWSLIRKEVEDSDWRLAIAGWDQTGHLAELKDLAARLHLESSVSFEGPLYGDAKADRFNAASAFILASLSEGLPMTILEAWSWGLPVLMTPECNLPEGASAGAAIMMTSEVESISNAIRQLFAMSDFERERMGTNGLKLVDERFKWPRIAEQMADVYDWALGVGPTPSCLLN